MPKPRLVLIEWLDHCFEGDKWNTLSDLTSEADKMSPCFAVGWIVSESKNFITLASHLSNMDLSKRDTELGGCLSIGKFGILKIHKLKL